LSRLLIDRKVSDVKIVCDGGDETFECHKAILASRSDVFSAMFEMTGGTESQTGVVKIDDISAKTMKSILAYIYRNHVSEQDIDMPLLLAADKYNLAELASKCQKILKYKIAVDTVLDILAANRLLSCQDLFESGKNFIRSCQVKNLNQDGELWKQLMAENPIYANEMLKICIN
jgi:speckle-type POZ protein